MISSENVMRGGGYKIKNIERQAFTLVEMSVVIVIITILLSVIIV
jgi:prepilin-type N-terminal cleavage/methylation domain-containing protein